MIPLVEGKRAEVAELCGRYGFERLDLLGSATGEGFDPEPSDLDFAVSFERRDPSDLFGRYFGPEEDLEALFGRKADLVMEGALQKSRRFSANVEASRMSLCGPEERALKDLEELLRPRRMSDHLFDHLSVGI